MEHSAKHIIDLNVKWAAQLTPDHLSGVIYVGSQSVCVVGGRDADGNNAILSHIVALRDLAIASAKYRAAVAALDQMMRDDTGNDGDALHRAECQAIDASVAIDNALIAAGDAMATHRAAADDSDQWETDWQDEDEVEVPHES